jgi:hypothetical protein
LSADHWVVGEHRLDGTPTLPGTAYLDLVCVSALDRGWSFPLRVRELLLLDPLVVRDGDAVEAGISTEETGAGLAVTVSTGQGERRRPHMTARLIRGDDAPPASGLLDLSILEAEYPELLGGAARRGFGVEVGPRWQCLRWARRSEGGIVGCLELEDEFVSADRGFMLHPALLDVATGLSDQDELPYLPFSYCDVVIHEPLPARLYSRVRVRGGGSGDSRSRRAEVVLAADDGRIVLSIGDYVLRRRGAHDARV